MTSTRLRCALSTLGDKDKGCVALSKTGPYLQVHWVIKVHDIETKEISAISELIFVYISHDFYDTNYNIFHRLILKKTG